MASSMDHRSGLESCCVRFTPVPGASPFCSVLEPGDRLSPKPGESATRLVPRIDSGTRCCLEPVHIIYDERTRLCGFRRPRLVEEHRAKLLGYLIPPEQHLRDWEYGASGERYPCWTVAKDLVTDAAIVYSVHGHGASSPWGLVFLSDLCFGMDSGWFLRLEEAFVDSYHAAVALEPSVGFSTASLCGAGEQTPVERHCGCRSLQ